MNAIATRTMAITYAEPCDKGWLVHLPTGPRLVSDTEHAYLIAAQDAPGTVVQFSKPPTRRADEVSPASSAPQVGGRPRRKA